MTKLPSKWCIRITDENKDILRKYWLIIVPPAYREYTFEGWLLSSRYDGSYMNWSDSLPDGYTPITLDQFKKWILLEKDGSELVGIQFKYRPDRVTIYTISKVENGNVLLTWDDDKTTYPLERAYRNFETGNWIVYKSKDTVKQKSTNMPIAALKTQSINRENVKEIYDAVCSKWQRQIDELLKASPFSNTITVSNEFLAQAFKEADATQHKLLLKYFIEPFESKDVDMKEWIKDTERFHDSCNHLLEVREDREYEGKAFYLRSDFNWEIKVDSDGLKCLVPTKK